MDIIQDPIAQMDIVQKEMDRLFLLFPASCEKTRAIKLFEDSMVQLAEYLNREKYAWRIR